MNDTAFREHILNLLNSGDAHQDFDSGVRIDPEGDENGDGGGKSPPSSAPVLYTGGWFGI